MKTVKIDITWGDINQGRKKNCERCPVALAILRALKIEKHVFVGGTNVTIPSLGFNSFAFPEEVTRFIENFDSWRHVEPFSFILEIPEGVL